MENENFETVSVDTTPVSTPKSKAVAGVLAILLGVYGIHNFYLGNIKKAVIQLSITVGTMILMFISVFFLALIGIITFGLGMILTPVVFIFILGPFAVQIWSLIEGVQILSGTINVDGQGNPLAD